MTAERRRAARTLVSEMIAMHTDVKHRVKLLDISLSGALMASNAAIPVGARGRLRATAPGCVLDLPFEVKRCKPAMMTGAFAVAARFGEMDDNSQRALERFLQRASE